jgi:hypothetical protein
MFIGRTELLPEDETTHEHEIAKGEEAVLMTTDRDGVGLFKGAFRGGRLRQMRDALRPMHDPHDNVDRCPDCHWELEGHDCYRCGWSRPDAEGFSDEDDSDGSDSEDDVHGPLHGVRPRFNAGNFLRALDNGADPFDFDPELSDDADSVITISSDVDDVDPIDHELAGTDADTNSDAESDLPEAMGGRPRQHPVDYLDPQMRLAMQQFYANDAPSTHYDDSEMGDTNAETTSETGESDEEETEDDDSSEMEDFLDHDTPTHIPHRALVQTRYNENGEIYISSDNDESGDEEDTNRESSQAPTNTTNASGTVDSSSDESSEDESRRTPVPRSRPSRPTRVILDDSDEEQDQEDVEDGGSDAEQSDATTIPAQPMATRRSHLQSQRARRGQIASRRTSASPPRRLSAPYSRSGSRRPLQAIANRRGMAQTYAAG